MANVAYFLAYIMKKNHNVDSTVFQPKIPRDEPTKKIIYGYESGNPLNNSLKYYNNKNKFVQHLNTLRFAFDDFEIIHLHEGGQVFGSVMAKLSGAKIIRHFHGSDLRKSWGVPKRAVIKTFYKLIKEDKVLLSTPDLINYLPWHNQRVVAENLPNLLDPTLETVGESEKNRSIFLPTRHDEDVKRTSIAFKAWKEIREYDDQIVLRTISWGKDFASFFNDYKNDRRIEWLPPLNRIQYIKELEKSTLVWGQFKLRMFGLTELEAMYSNRPIFTDIDLNAYDSLPPLTNLQCRSPKVLSLETKRLLENEEKLKETITYQKKWVEQKYNPKIISGKLYNIYSSLLNDNN